MAPGHQTGHKEPLQDQFATLLYVKTRRKKITVHQGLTNDKWIDHIFPSTTQEEVIQFVRLWEATRGVVLRDTKEDCITWRWTANREYTTSSAYQIQFIGVFSKIKLTRIWKAKVEQKCLFFAWTLMHKKTLKANNLFKR